MPLESMAAGTETLVGFDCRQMPDGRWTASRREAFLLREDVNQPLAVDQTAWASALPENEDAWRGVLGHWSNLDKLRQRCRTLPASTSARWEVAITFRLDATSPEKGAEWVQQNLEPTQPATIQCDWEFLGLDVADGWLLSGLSNCAYEPGLRASWQASWSQHLNEHHLFASLEKAREFAVAVGRRVPSHAPFFVFGLYLVGRL